MSKTVVIVGASRGIGLEIAKQFAEAGNTVYALSRDTVKMNKAFNSYPNIKIFSFDLSGDVLDQTQVISTNIGTIDILINNAGFLVNKPFLHLTREDIQTSYQINVMSAFEIFQAAIDRKSVV
jgi:short-subunit dehydrogenase